MFFIDISKSATKVGARVINI